MKTNGSDATTISTDGQRIQLAERVPGVRRVSAADLYVPGPTQAVGAGHSGSVVQPFGDRRVWWLERIPEDALHLVSQWEFHRRSMDIRDSGRIRRGPHLNG